jgi:putative oxidoreductase
MATTRRMRPVALPAFIQHWEDVTRWLGTWAAPLTDLILRVLIFRVFFVSGLIKISDWQGALFLFQEEYKVPLLPPEAAAMLAATFELAASSLVLIGLAARLAALPLIGMTCVIQFVLGSANPSYDSFDHFLWLGALLAIVARGAGALSIDYLIARRMRT